MSQRWTERPMEDEKRNVLYHLLEYREAPRDFLFSDSPEETIRFCREYARTHGMSYARVLETKVKPTRESSDLIHPYLLLLGTTRQTLHTNLRRLVRSDPEWEGAYQDLIEQVVQRERAIYSRTPRPQLNYRRQMIRRDKQLLNVGIEPTLLPPGNIRSDSPLRG